MKRMPRNNICVCRLRLLLFQASIAFITMPITSASVDSQDNLYSLFQIGLSSADIVILPDASKSMLNHHYSEVRKAVIDFAASLSENENLHLRIFGDVVSNPLEGKGDEITSLIEDYFPREPLFEHTDLGLAISKGLEFLERDGGSEIQAFFLITDGLHQPAAGSSYSRDFANDPHWQALKNRALALCPQRHVLVYGFGLGQQTDIAVLRNVFPAENVEVVIGSPSQIVQTLRSARERLSRAQLRKAIHEELNTGTTKIDLSANNVEVEEPYFDVTLIIRNDYSRLPIIVERIEVQRAGDSSDEIACVVEGLPVGSRLEPGKQITVRVKGEMARDQQGIRLGKDERSVRGTFHLMPVICFAHQTALGQFGIDLSATKFDNATLSVQMRVQYGLSFVTIAAAALALAGLSAAVGKHVKKKKVQLRELAKQRIESNRLAGILEIQRICNDESHTDSIDLGQYKAQELALAVTEQGGLEAIPPSDHGREVVARLSSHLNRYSAFDTRPEPAKFHLTSTGKHTLRYGTGGEMREALTITLCDNDVIELDGRWKLRYSDPRRRTRAEFESAATGGENSVQ